jgi:hypothetical protein
MKIKYLTRTFKQHEKLLLKTIENYNDEILLSYTQKKEYFLHKCSLLNKIRMEKSMKRNYDEFF